MERTLPVPSASEWDEVCDSFTILDSDAKITSEGSELILHWPDSVVTITWLGENEPVWEPAGRGGNWVVRYDRDALAGIDQLTHHWELRLQTAG